MKLIMVADDYYKMPRLKVEEFHNSITNVFLMVMVMVMVMVMSSSSDDVASVSSGGDLIHLSIRTKIDIADLQSVQSSKIVTGVAWSPDSTKLATYSDYGAQIDVWRIDGSHVSGWRRTAFDIPFVNRSIAFLDNRTLMTPPEGTALEVADTALSIWDVARGVEEERVPGVGDKGEWRKNFANLFTLSLDRKLVAASSATGPYIALYPTKNFRDAIRLLVGNYTSAVALSSDGSMLAVGTPLGIVRLYDTRSRKLIREIDAFSDPNTIVQVVVFSPDDSKIVVGAGLQIGAPIPSPLRVFNILDGSRMNALVRKDLQPIRDIAWSNDGQYIGLATDKGSWLWSASSGILIPIEKAAAMALAFSPDSNSLAVCYDHQVAVFDVPRRTPTKE